MESFADYILNEKNLLSKIEIVYYLSKKKTISFNKSIVFKTEIMRMFLNYSRIDIDKNLILTASLLCNCKKIDNAQNLESIHSYAKIGADFLHELGFNKRFCKIVEQINRYTKSEPRERESDILELADQFGAMLLDRPERIGFKPDEALILLEHRNLKDCYNRYLDLFKDFVGFMEKINFNETVAISGLNKLVKIYNETEKLNEFIEKVINEYEPKIDCLMEKQEKIEAGKMFQKIEDPNRPLFSKKTVIKIMNELNNDIIQEERLKEK